MSADSDVTAGTIRIWIEAADFEDYGGWTLDTQYVHAMGSPYLIAPFLGGKPAADASTRVVIPEDGRYRLWVRARNWITDHAPGRFTVSIDGKLCAREFGAAPDDRWIWEDGGFHDLEKGARTVCLRDLTGWFSRCNALVLTTDESWEPPLVLGRLREERLTCLGRPCEPHPGGRHDLIVVGGGPGGFPAALQAARLGLNVLLIHDRPILGGNASSEIAVPFDGANSRQSFARETGITEEIFWIKRNTRNSYDRIFKELAEAEPNLTIVLNRRVISAETSGDRIESVIARDVITSVDYEYTAELFIDATGDGWLGYFAGADFMFGRESRSAFGESLAPEVPDDATMSGCLRGPFGPERIIERDTSIAFEAPAWAPRFSPDFEEYRSIPNVAPFHWWLEHPNDLDDVENGEECRDELIKLNVGYWDYIKNRWSRRQEAENFELNYIPFLNGRREGRRLTGEYVLTEDDCRTGRNFPDTIAYAGWPIDLHHPKGVYSGKEGPFHANLDVPLVKVPYRCLYSRNIRNLLMAGRDISVTHIALGTVRVENQCAITGQAAGLAAYLCSKYGKNPKELHDEHLSELQQLCLKQDLYLPGVRHVDPADLALFATAEASSMNKWEEFSTQKGYPGGWAGLTDCIRAVFFPLEGDLHIDTLYLRLRNDSHMPRELAMHVFEDEAPGVFSDRSRICTTRGVIGPEAESWVGFPVKNDFTMKYAWVYLEPAEDVFIQRMVSGKLDTYLAWKHDPSVGWTIPPRHQFYQYALEKPIVEYADGGPANVNNGWSRAIDAERYMWISDPNQGYPQWIRLDWPEQKSFNTVYLTFDTDLNNPSMNGKTSTKMSPRCVADYELQVYEDNTGSWRTIHLEENNYFRRRVHRFPQVYSRTLRLKVLNTIGDYSARVYEIQVYDE